MRSLLSELCSLLLQQKNLLEQMLELASEKRRIIINGEADLLEDIVRKELKELTKLNNVEKKRVALHPRLSEEFDVPEEEITITEIAKCADPNERETIIELQTQLTALLSRHRELNNENQELIRSHFEYTETMIDLMVDSEDPLNHFYGLDGKTAPERKKATGFFDGSA